MSEPQLPSAQARAVAEALRPALAAFETICLDAGRRLAEAVPGLQAVSGWLASVSDELLSPEMVAANSDLEAISLEVSRFSTLLAAEDSDIRALAQSVCEIGAQVEKAQGCARTLGALVFSLRIEAAQWAGGKADMMDFARSLQEIVGNARASLADYALECAALDVRLRAAAAYLSGFKDRHAVQMTRLAAAVDKSMASMSGGRLRAAELLGAAAVQSRAMGENIGQCVAALQIGDSTRQRAEHVAEALCLAADALDAGEGRPFIHAGVCYGGDRGRLALRLLELQRMQIAGAYQDFTAETGRIATLLTRLDADGRAISQRSLDAFGSADTADSSFLESLGRDLAAARVVVEEGARTREGVDEAKKSAADALERMEARIGALTSIALEVSMIGTNASLRSSRLGDAGKGVALIAAELRDLGRQIYAATEAIAALLRDIGACMRRYSFMRGVDAAKLSELAARMVRATGSFEVAGRNMARTLKDLRAETARTHDELAVAARALAGSEPAAQTLKEAESGIRDVARLLPPAGPEAGEEDRFLDAVQGPAYSMIAERRIHHQLTGAFGQALAQKEEPAAAEADAFML